MVRDRTYLFYSIYLISNAAYAAFVWFRADADLRGLLSPAFDSWFDYFALTTTSAMVGYLAFIQSFLNLKNLLPWWHRFFNRLIYLAIPVFLAVLFILGNSQFSNIQATYIMFTYTVLNLIVGLIFIIPIAKTKDIKAYFFLAGFIALVLGASIAAITRFSNESIFFVQFYHAGVLLEVTFFSLGLAYKQQMNEKERQKVKFALAKSQFLQEQQRAEANRLKEMEQFKNRLYTNITHEFRTPLTVIMGMADNIRGHKNECKLIKHNSQNLLRLVNELLDLSKLENGTLSLDLTKGEIITYLQYLTESFYSMAEKKQIRLTFYSEIPALIMDYDEVKIQHIIYNLLSNALKFTQSGGKALMHIHQIEQDAQSFLIVKIQDTGIGIPEKELPYIFNRFYQVDNFSTRKGEGVGIGLALTKELLTLMEGTIKVESIPQKGTTFTLRIPIIQELQTQNSKAENFSEAIEVPSIELVDNQPVRTNGNLPLLLVIEDNRDIISYIQSILEKDYQVQTAFNGQEGIARAIELIPDLIISDVMMPKKDGYEVCQMLKMDERTSHIPIIMLTAKAGEVDKIKGLKAGADAYLRKPFNKEELLVRLKKLLELRQNLQERYAQFPATLFSSKRVPILEDIFLQKLKALMEKNLDNMEFGMEVICKKMHLSYAQLYRKIKALTGQSPTIFIRKIRLEKALNLLQNTNLNISEIAYKTGFSDPNYFSRVFAEAFGVSPSTIRSKV